MPIPKSSSKKRRIQMLRGKVHHTKKPDLTNLIKHAEDCLKGTVIQDDAQVVEISARKIYAEVFKSLIQVIPIEENDPSAP